MNSTAANSCCSAHTSADSCCYACLASALTNPQSDGLQRNLFRTNSYVVQELIIKQLWVVQTMDQATCSPIPGLSDIICSPFTYQCYQHCVCRASIFEVISPDDWPTAYSGPAHDENHKLPVLNKIHPLTWEWMHCILAMPQSEIGSIHLTDLTKLMVLMKSNVNSIDQLVTKSIYLNTLFTHARAQRLKVMPWLTTYARPIKPCLT